MECPVRSVAVNSALCIPEFCILESGQGNAPCDHCFADSSVRLLGRRTVKLEREGGYAPPPQRWQRCVLLLDHTRMTNPECKMSEPETSHPSFILHSTFCTLHSNGSQGWFRPNILPGNNRPLYYLSYLGFPEMDWWMNGKPILPPHRSSNPFIQ